MNIEFDMYQTLALAVLVLLLGSFLKKHFIFWKNSVFRHLLSADCYLLSLLVYAIPRELLNFPLMIRSEKSVWYFSLHQ